MTDDVVSFVTKKIEMRGSESVSTTSNLNDPLLRRLVEALAFLARKLKQFSADVGCAIARGTVGVRGDTHAPDPRFGRYSQSR